MLEINMENMRNGLMTTSNASVRTDEYATPDLAIQKTRQLSTPLIAVVTSILSEYYTHRNIDLKFPEFGFPGEPPEGSKTQKIETWLRRLNNTHSLQTWNTLGRTLEEFMEINPWEMAHNEEFKTTTEKNRERIKLQLAKEGMVYHQGGIIVSMGGSASPAASFEVALRSRDYPTLDSEFQRSLSNCESNPEDAVTAACNILESLFKIIIEENTLQLPAEQSLIKLWEPVRKFFRLNTDAYRGEESLRNIVQGLASVIHGIAELRTQRGNAHGRGKTVYKLSSRHARLAVSASHTVARFIFDVWDEVIKTPISK